LKIEEIERQIADLQAEIERLPFAKAAPMPRTRQGLALDPIFLKQGHSTLWMEIDLGKMVKPELIVIVPLPNEQRSRSSSHCLFRASLSDRPTGDSDAVIADLVEPTLSIAGSQIVLITNEASHSGRYLRITPVFSENFEDNIRKGVTVSEVFVFKGEQNIALGSPVTASVNQPLDGYDGLKRLTDGWSPLGAPIDQTKSGKGEGYHSYFNGGPLVPKDPYWVQIDLGEERPVDQINLLPVIPHTFSQSPGYGFPVRFKIEAALEPEFSEPIILFDSTSEDFPAPRIHCLSFAGNSCYARYVRLTVTKLTNAGWNTIFFALSEMQVISGGINVSEGRPVQSFRSYDETFYSQIEKEFEQSKDVAFHSQWKSWNEQRRFKEVQGKYDRQVLEGSRVWGRNNLVDGFSGGHKLLARPEWFTKLYQRELLEIKLSRLMGIKQSALTESSRRSKALLFAGLSMAVALLIISVALSVCVNIKANRTIKTRLAQDLHDDLSSELCSISLVSQMLEESGSFREKEDQIRMRAISESARRSVDSLRDVIFLTRGDRFTWRHVVTRFREIAESMLVTLGIEYAIECDEERIFSRKSSPKHLQGVIFIYKEVLNNICKHSGASEVMVDISADVRYIMVRIKDNGRGFDPNAYSDCGFGIKSMKMRAKRLRGSVAVQSKRGKGTSVTIKLSR